MAEIIPRWEWRTFGAEFGEAETLIRQSGDGKVRESGETYIVSAASSNNTKVRDMLMDIKRLQQVNADKLEQWNPVMKSGFPLTPIVLLDVFRAWNLAMPKFQREEYSFEQFLAEIVRPHPQLRAIAVAKRRCGFTVNGCIVEIADLTFDDAPIRTVAVEQEDPARVIATVRQLRLNAFENINYVKALKRSKGIAEA
jgi:exopolyphosphatase/guanosine-5'-triphosphate,3'-diphosphate pyrophosphatase